MAATSDEVITDLILYREEDTKTDATFQLAFALLMMKTKQFDIDKRYLDHAVRLCEAFGEFYCSNKCREDIQMETVKCLQKGDYNSFEKFFLGQLTLQADYCFW